MADIAVTPLNNNTITPAPQPQAISPGGDPALWDAVYKVTASVSNTGAVNGSAVAQLYVTFPDNTTPSGTPPYQLRGFDKVFLVKGKSKTVSFERKRRDLSFWDIVTQQWLIPSGEFTLSVGFSSKDLGEVASLTAILA